jgi:small multidrug resistance pump
MQVAYVLLGSAIVAEVCGTMALRASDGFSRVAPATLTVVAYGLSFYLVSHALRRLDVGLVYATWAGTGTALVAVLGIAFLNEPITALKATSLALIVAGVVGLNLQEAH